jgi:hypothetical protein
MVSTIGTVTELISSRRDGVRKDKMSQTMTNLLYHIVFSIKNRMNLVTPDVSIELYPYIGGIINGEKGNAMFLWQKGYGAFSVSESAADSVRKYIVNQEIHHRKYSFEDEYIAILKKHNIQYDENYIWE